MGYADLIKFPMDLQYVRKIIVANRPAVGGVGAGAVSNLIIRNMFGGGVEGGEVRKGGREGGRE